MDSDAIFDDLDFVPCIPTFQQFSSKLNAPLASSSSLSVNDLFYSSSQMHKPYTQQPRGRALAKSSANGFSYHTNTPKQQPRSPPLVSVELQLKIFEFALELETPRRVFINYDKEWRSLRLTQGERFQHTSAITNVELKKEKGRPHDGWLAFTLREFSKQETRAMSQALWPSLLRVSRMTRFECSKLFYQYAPFTSPGDPYTIPEWEARLPTNALQYLSQNQSLVMEHVCCEVQQWRCLRNYLYNPLRQPYTVINPDRLTKYWGPGEVELRRQHPSIPWKFVQLYTLEGKFGHSFAEHYRNSQLESNSQIMHHNCHVGLHEVLHSEFHDEIQRIHDTGDTSTMATQLRNLADGMQSLLDSLAGYDGMMELKNWLEEWMMDPCVGVPSRLYRRTCAGGLFFGVHMWENDIMVFAKDLQDNIQA